MKILQEKLDFLIEKYSVDVKGKENLDKCYKQVFDAR